MICGFLRIRTRDLNQWTLLAHCKHERDHSHKIAENMALGRYLADVHWPVACADDKEVGIARSMFIDGRAKHITLEGLKGFSGRERAEKGRRRVDEDGLAVAVSRKVAIFVRFLLKKKMKMRMKMKRRDTDSFMEVFDLYTHPDLWD